jgi:hypothetical protein
MSDDRGFWRHPLSGDELLFVLICFALGVCFGTFIGAFW